MARLGMRWDCCLWKSPRKQQDGDAEQLALTKELLTTAPPSIGPQFHGLSPNLNLPAGMCNRFDWERMEARGDIQGEGLDSGS